MKAAMEADLRRQLDEALARTEPRTPGEQRKAAQELREYEEKYGLEALNRKLFKDAGLE